MTALLHVILLMTFVTALSAGAAMLARIEVLLAQVHRNERDAAYGAQAMLAAALQDLDRAPDWNDVLAGLRQASFSDGSVSAPRQIPGGGSVVVCCAPGSMTARAQADSGLAWRPFGWQSLRQLLGVPDGPPQYLAAWVVDDPGDADGDDAADSNGRLALRVESVTPRGVRKAVEVLVERAPVDPVNATAAPGLKILIWRELR